VSYFAHDIVSNEDAVYINALDIIYTKILSYVQALESTEC